MGKKNRNVAVAELAKELEATAEVVVELGELEPTPSTVTVEAQPEVVAPATTVHQGTQVLYRVVAPKRPLTGVKFGVSGNEFTHTKLAEFAAANGGVLTDQQARQVCVDAAHKGFYNYAVKRLKILVEVAADVETVE